MRNERRKRERKEWDFATESAERRSRNQMLVLVVVPRMSQGKVLQPEEGGQLTATGKQDFDRLHRRLEGRKGNWICSGEARPAPGARRTVNSERRTPQRISLFFHSNQTWCPLCLGGEIFSPRFRPSFHFTSITSFPVVFLLSKSRYAWMISVKG